ncbi:hypothetical protein EBB56_13430 [Halomonas sp. YLB-10]|uniref:hypothetical protein n=1 Tax=Halomonas sp. YLB-10 TaxID=2483111 RepID=UPI000F5DCB9E|nr:hypothetical protein [Halomonas sp. YLB-10]RQW70342.1 hypothetical protein EBB56_13430 [Halomonas sp. YLB-10]
MPETNPITTTNGQRSAFKPLVWLVGVIGILRYSLADLTIAGLQVPAFDSAGYVGLMGAISARYCGRHVTKSWERIKNNQHQKS